MAQMKIIGVRPYRFTPDGQTETISGYTVWALEDAGTNGKGQLPVKLGMNEEIYNSLIVANGGFDKLAGKDVDVVFNRYGKVESLVPLK